MSVGRCMPVGLLVLALASACASLPPRAGEGPSTHRYRAAGNEPFWSVDVDGARLVFRTPENVDGTVIPAERLIDGTDVVFTQRAGNPPFLLRLKPGPC
ncbi:hypothetical protein [Luteimonas vadosa]